jgi:uncharacterized protein (DUF1499 family)
MKRVVLLALVVAAALALTKWPRIADVETGQTPEYPDLKDQSYVAREDQVVQAAKETIATLPRWTFVGAGKGPGGSEIKAVATVLNFKHDVTIRVHWTGGRTVVSVRSKSRNGPVDFGQNARNIQEFFAGLNKRVV